MTCSHGWASSAPCPLCALIAERDEYRNALRLRMGQIAELRAERDALKALLAASVAVLRQWAPNEVDLIQHINTALQGKP